MNIDTALGRAQLAEIIPDVRKHVPNVKLKTAWVYNVSASRHGDHWEFHYGTFYWHGTADGAYDARARGWSAYLRKLGVEGY